MMRLLLLILLVVCLLPRELLAEMPAISVAGLEQEFGAQIPRQWGEVVPGVRTRVHTSEKLLVLTLDACGSPKGKGVDQGLIDFLVQEQVPAVLFINARWIDANPGLFKQLAANPLFEIANHGMWHKPASVSGRSVYGINGTKNIAELVQEIDLNRQKIEAITSRKTRYYRSGTAYYDEIAVQIAARLGHEVVGYSLLGDAGATYSASQVKAAFLAARPGDIILAHMNHPEAGTGAGIKAAIPELKKRGFRFVRLSEVTLR